MKKLITILLIMSSPPIYADELKLTGMPSIAFNKDNSFLNFGGPAVKIEFGQYFGGLTFFPSIRKDSTVDTVTPILGAGIYAGKGNLFFIVPNYYYNNNWYSALGIGYKF